MFDRFDEWNEDWLREEMEAVPPSIVKPKKVTRTELILAALDDRPQTTREIGMKVGETPSATGSFLGPLRKAGKAASVKLDNGLNGWVRA